MNPPRRLLGLTIVQAAAFLVARLSLSALSVDLDDPSAVYAQGVVQGVLAFGLSLWLRNARWLQVMHLLAPLVAISLLHTHIPAGAYLGVFLILLGFNWYVMRNRVPYFPSGSSTWQAVSRVLPDTTAFSFVDIGSGLGGLNFYLAKHKSLGTFTGVEISPVPFAWSFLRNSLSLGRCLFQRRDFNDLDLSAFDFVFAYLSPAVMPEVWAKASREMRVGSKFMSFEFDIPDVEANEVHAAGMGGRPLYIWTIE